MKTEIIFWLHPLSGAMTTIIIDLDNSCNMWQLKLNLGLQYKSVSINNQPIPFQMDWDGHDFHALFQYMFYTSVQNCMRIESFFNKILNVKHG